MCRELSERTRSQKRSYHHCCTQGATTTRNCCETWEVAAATRCARRLKRHFGVVVALSGDVYGDVGGESAGSQCIRMGGHSLAGGVGILKPVLPQATKRKRFRARARGRSEQLILENARLDVASVSSSERRGPGLLAVACVTRYPYTPVRSPFPLTIDPSPLPFPRWSRRHHYCRCRVCYGAACGMLSFTARVVVGVHANKGPLLLMSPLSLAIRTGPGCGVHRGPCRRRQARQGKVVPSVTTVVVVLAQGEVNVSDRKEGAPPYHAHP
ncbi:hypothetical protein EDB85DRAFT_2001719 [Lactarius pseudohatsudake]|nr:hypothetical protein EDB85DRAFT_2001719 [Lactarius pseudohatsudake]